MSLPKIPDINPNINITREDSINILIASVGLEELALAHILNAEGEKIQYILGTLEGRDPGEVTVCDVMKVNESVNKTLKNVIATEMLLMFKLEDAIGLGNGEECRKNLTIQKIWKDGNNAHNTRPASVDITLLRDGEVYDTVTLTAVGDWTHTFRCLPAGNGSKQYEYTVDERVAPVGYRKSVSGYNITNSLDTITLTGTKTWDDNHNASVKRPGSIVLRLLQNGKQFRVLTPTSPPVGQDVGQFEFTNVPFADAEGRPFVYSVLEDEIEHYKSAIDGFNITNTLKTGEFSFNKTSTATGLSLQGAVFEIRQNGSLISASSSDVGGKVSFDGLLAGAYQMTETISPIGYMDNTNIYDVVVSNDGTVTIDGLPAALFSVRNTPKPDEVILRRATSVNPAYMAAPNTWPLHGATGSNLYMLDKILITLPRPATTVKWAYGVQDKAYFRFGGGIDITTTYNVGFHAPLNTDYTVYAMFNDGTDIAAYITVDRLRDGSTEMPYLLIDFNTADAIEPSVPGIDNFTLYYMQGNGVKLTQNYEIYENIDMEGKTWEPLGPLQTIGRFTGSLYGNGNDIKNLSIGDEMTYDYLGFFRFIGDGANIQNLNIVDCNIESYYIATGFAAYVWVENGGSVLMKDLHFDGVLKARYTSGIAGISVVNDGSLIIEKCNAEAEMEALSHAGGIIADCQIKEGSSMLIAGCSAYGSMTGAEQSSSGGIAGRISSEGSIIISDCFSAVAINSPTAGGIAGLAEGTGSTEISSCYNKGSIGGGAGGGIAGHNTKSVTALNITNCYNSGTVTAGGGGGIYGDNEGIILAQNCYNTGNVISAGLNGIAGGISLNYGNIENCASLSQTVTSDFQTARISAARFGVQSNLNNNVAFDNMQVLISGVQKFPLDTGSAGTDGISLNRAQIKTQGLYETTLGWDFTNIWSFGNGTYTLPILRGIPASLQPTVLPPHLT